MRKVPTMGEGGGGLHRRGYGSRHTGGREKTLWTCARERGSGSVRTRAYKIGQNEIDLERRREWKE